MFKCRYECRKVAGCCYRKTSGRSPPYGIYPSYSSYTILSLRKGYQQGHALTPLLTAWPQEPTFPFLTILVSGGHTLLLLATSVNSFKILATTGDESIGRSFDKVSKLLQLKWTKLGPGDALEKFCAEEQKDEACLEIPPLPRPMPKKLAFSFSALHSHVKLFIESIGGFEKLDTPMKRSIARAFQTGAVLHLEDKLVLALDWCRSQNIYVQSVVVSGGVASNGYLRQRYDYVYSFVDTFHTSSHLKLAQMPG